MPVASTPMSVSGHLEGRRRQRQTYRVRDSIKDVTVVGERDSGRAPGPRVRWFVGGPLMIGLGWDLW